MGPSLTQHLDSSSRKRVRWGVARFEPDHLSLEQTLIRLGVGTLQPRCLYTLNPLSGHAAPDGQISTETSAHVSVCADDLVELLGGCAVIPVGPLMHERLDTAAYILLSKRVTLMRALERRITDTARAMNRVPATTSPWQSPESTQWNARRNLNN